MSAHHVCCRCGEISSYGITAGSAHFTWNGRDYPIRKRGARLLRYLLVRRYASIELAIWAVYGDDEDGGPEEADKAICDHVGRLNKALEAAGAPLSISGNRQSGYTLAPRKHEAAA